MSVSTQRSKAVAATLAVEPAVEPAVGDTPSAEVRAEAVTVGSFTVPPEAEIPGDVQPTYETLSVEVLAFDGEVQRALRADRVAKIIKGFQPGLLGVIKVSRRPDADGEIADFVVDGMHRSVAAQSVFEAKTHPTYDGTIHAQVYEGLSIQQEAGLFVGTNDTTRIPPGDMHRAALMMKDPVAHLVQGVLDDYGLVIGGGSAASIDAVTALYFLVSLDGEGGLLRETLDVLIMDDLSGKGGAWQVNKDNKIMFSAAVMKAVGLILYRYRDYSLHTPTLVEVMRNFRPRVLCSQGRSRLPQKAMHHGVAATLVEEYNVRRPKRSARINDWSPY